MSKLKSFRIIVDMYNREIKDTDRIMVIMQKQTPGQCISMVAYLFDNDPFEARIVGTPTELKGAEQAQLFTL